MSDPRIEEYLRQGRLAPIQVDDEELVSGWEKAMRPFLDALVPDLSPEGAFVRTYDAALMLATAVVNASGYRVRSRHHHQDTFDVLRRLGDQELEQLGSQLDTFRRERNQIQYDPETSPSTKQDTDIKKAVRRLIPAVQGALVRTRPSLDQSLHLPPGQLEIEELQE